MHKAVVEVADLVDDLRNTKEELALVQRKADLAVEEALNKLRKEMHEALMKSDIEREIAKASLAAYEKHDPKEERAVITEMLKSAVDGLVKAATAKQPQSGGGGGQQKQAGGNQEKKD